MTLFRTSLDDLQAFIALDAHHGLMRVLAVPDEELVSLRAAGLLPAHPIEERWTASRQSRPPIGQLGAGPSSVSGAAPTQAGTTVGIGAAPSITPRTRLPHEPSNTMFPASVRRARSASCVASAVMAAREIASSPKL